MIFPVYQTPPRTPLHHPTVSRATKLDWLKRAKIDKIPKNKIGGFWQKVHDTEQCNTAQHGAAPRHSYHVAARRTASRPQHDEARRCTAQHGAARRSTAQHGAARSSPAQHGAARRSTAQHGAARRSKASHRVAPRRTASH
jgi:hypothetical protein